MRPVPGTFIDHVIIICNLVYNANDNVRECSFEHTHKVMETFLPVKVCPNGTTSTNILGCVRHRAIKISLIKKSVDLLRECSI